MSKYSFEFKKKVVKAYLNGEGSYGYLSKTYGVPAKRNIEEWVHNYQKFGDVGLIRSRKNQTYSFKKKLSVVELYLSSEISYALTPQQKILRAAMKIPHATTKTLPSKPSIFVKKEGKKKSKCQQDWQLTS